MVKAAATSISSSAEVSDPATRTWTTTGSLNIARGAHTATLLVNGSVLVAGDMGNRGLPLSSAELFDPVTGTWTNTGMLSVPREGHMATLLPDGNVLVAGARATATLSFPARSCTDPATGTWTPTGGLATARRFSTATLLPNGQVLATGGGGASGYLASAELYDSGALAPIILTNGWRMPNGAFQFTFTSRPALGLSVFATTNLALPLSNWTAFGGVIELSPGWFQFTDLQATNNPLRFYRVHSP